MRRMILADLYSYRTHGWHQYGWPILPMEWYETIFWHGGAPYCYGLPHNVPTEWIATV